MGLFLFFRKKEPCSSAESFSAQQQNILIKCFLLLLRQLNQKTIGNGNFLKEANNSGLCVHLNDLVYIWTICKYIAYAVSVFCTYLWNNWYGMTPRVYSLLFIHYTALHSDKLPFHCNWIPTLISSFANLCCGLYGYYNLQSIKTQYTLINDNYY